MVEIAQIAWQLRIFLEAIRQGYIIHILLLHIRIESMTYPAIVGWCATVHRTMCIAQGKRLVIGNLLAQVQGMRFESPC